ncbi:MAG: ABC transporter permease [Flavobacteriaceae bacterium]|nr:ABC transporter permease [Flavobacteriaceae bacterium]
MNIWRISFKNIKSKPLYTLLSVFILSLSITLLLGIQQLKSSFEFQMENNLGGVDMVIGAKGSPLQLVLSSILHIDNPTGNIPYKEALKIGKNPMIKTAVPISYGDNYRGFRIVGTSPEFLTLYKAELATGKSVEKSLEVILGHQVAEQLQLKLGDTFLSSHGLVENDVDIHDDEFIVVGILKPTQKVIDRLIVSNLESIWDVHDHEDHDEEEGKHHDHDKEGEHEHKHEEDHVHDDDKEVTSLLISFRSPRAMLTLPRRINKKTNMQAALPKYELDKLYEYTGVGFTTITWIAYLILIISGMTIFLSLYKMVKERAFDLALLRTYGASNFQLIKMVAYEGFSIVGLAFIVGFLFTKLGLYLMFQFQGNSLQQSLIQELPLQQALKIIGLVFAMIIISILLAIYPIIKMNISKILSHEK